MAMTRKITSEELEIFNYLNDLRKSGECNMFGAVPYIQDEFGLDLREARKVLNLWMDNYNADGIYDIIEVKGLYKADSDGDYEIEKLFYHHADICQFEEGDSEYLLDLDEFKNIYSKIKFHAIMPEIPKGSSIEKKFTEEDLVGFVDYMYSHRTAHKYKDGYGDFRVFSDLMKSYIQSLNQSKNLKQ